LEGMLASQGMPNLSEYISKQELDDIKKYVLYSADKLGTGTNPNDLMVSIAQMQYLADQEPTAVKN